MLNENTDSLYKNLKSMLYDKAKKWVDRYDTSIKSRCGDEVLKKLREESISVKFDFNDGLNVCDKKFMKESPDITDAIAYSFVR